MDYNVIQKKEQMMVWFPDFIFDDWNEEYISRDGVEPDEVAEAIRNAAFMTRSRRGTYQFVGQTDAGRSLAIILASRRYGVLHRHRSRGDAGRAT